MNKARVYKRGGLDWAWHHACPGRWPAASGGLYSFQYAAFVAAMDHLKRCIG